MHASFKLLSLAAVAALVTGAGVARADVTVSATVVKTKDIAVTKQIDILKLVTVAADALIFGDSTSEQDIVINQSNQFNFAEDEESTAGNAITNSFNTSAGEFATIQNNGFNNNNENSDSLSFAVTSGLGDGNIIDAEVNLEQVNGSRGLDGVVYDTAWQDTDTRGINVFESIDGVTYSNDISSSFNDTSGVAKTIQENGSNNNNANAVAIALGDFAVFALDEVNVGQWNTYNFANARAANRTNGITDSFTNFNGLTATIQDNGSNNNNANTSAISASTTGAPSPGGIPVGGLGGIN